MDFPLLAFLFYKKFIQLDRRPFKFRSSVAITALSALLFSANLFLAEIERPDLLSRGFSNYYIVRALSLPAFLGYSANQSYSVNKERAKASETDHSTYRQTIFKNILLSLIQTIMAWPKGKM